MPPRMTTRTFAPWTRATAWLGLMLTAVTFARPAAAQDAMVLSLIDLSAEEAATREIAFDVARAIKKSKQVRYADFDAALNLGGEEIQVSSGRTADQLVKSGLAKLKAGNAEDAAEDLDNAVGNYLIAYAVLADTTVLPRTLALLGAAQFLAGDPKGAAKNFEKAVQADQKTALDVSEYSPKAQAALDTARKNVSAREQVDFEIRTDPPNARVYVNGRYMGLTPTFASSSRGDQMISITKQGFKRKARKVTIDKAGQVVDEHLEPAQRAAAFESLARGLEKVVAGDAAPEALSETSGLTGTPYVLLLRSSGTREKMRVQMALANLDSRQVINQLARDIKWENRDKETREQIDKMVDEVLKPRTIVGATNPGEVQAKPIYKRWWFWTILGAVAVGSAAAYTLAPTSQPSTPPYAPGTGGLLIQF